MPKENGIFPCCKWITRLANTLRKSPVQLPPRENQTKKNTFPPDERPRQGFHKRGEEEKYLSGRIQELRNQRAKESTNSIDQRTKYIPNAQGKNCQSAPAPMNLAPSNIVRGPSNRCSSFLAPLRLNPSPMAQSFHTKTKSGLEQNLCWLASHRLHKLGLGVGVEGGKEKKNDFGSFAFILNARSLMEEGRGLAEKEVLLVLSFPESDSIQIVIFNGKIGLVVVTPFADADLGSWVGQH